MENQNLITKILSDEFSFNFQHFKRWIDSGLRLQDFYEQYDHLIFTRFEEVEFGTLWFIKIDFVDGSKAFRNIEGKWGYSNT